MQRKLVNIGAELVAAPSLLLLDEPTSGLDSAAARGLVATLLQVTHQAGVTTAAVVHQPRHDAFLLFDRVLFLGRGGRSAYCGPVAQAEAYFQRLGFVLPLHANPAGTCSLRTAASHNLDDKLCKIMLLGNLLPIQGFSSI